MAAPVEAAALAQELIRCPSVTPADAGSLGVLEGALKGLGFATHRLAFQEDGTAEVANLYARWGHGGPNFCFAGHTDVVPVGDRAAWSVDPFGGAIEGGVLYGRGACDMKGAVAAFAAAAGRFLERRAGTFQGSISLLVTGDEEGPAVNGTRKVLGWLKDKGETLDACVVGEPTASDAVADTIKIGRRGSLNARLAVMGAQGHTAYPHLADNPIPRLVAVLHRLAGATLDAGTEHFQASTLQITTVDVGNPATNVIPAEARAGFNIRFNDAHSGASLRAWLEETCREMAGAHRLDVSVSGESFLTPPSRLADLLARAAERVTGRRPAYSTTGGTSDARFIKDVCPVAEMGLVGRTMHKVDEQVPLADLARLTDVYEAVLDDYFAG